MNQWRKGIASWHVGKTLYISVPFTWLVADAERMARAWKGEVKIGGPGLMKPTECEGFEPILFHNPCATFTTRGCPNRCGFCAVPKLEGEFREIQNFRPAPTVCDNNLLAASRKHLERVVDALKVYPLVDFNQGLEARRFTADIADLFQSIRFKARFSFDSQQNESSVKTAIDLCQSRGLKDITIFCLIGFKDTPEEARSRMELVRQWGATPFPMRYQPLDSQAKNQYVSPAWTERELLDTTRYYSRLKFGLEAITFEEYNAPPKEQLPLDIEA